MGWPPRFLFLSGRLCLDLAQTGGEGRWAVFERLNEPGDLADWLRECSLDLEVATVSEADLRAARRLRSAIWSCARAIVRGASLPEERTAEIERFARRPDLVPCLEEGRRVWSRDSRVGQALSHIARDAIELFGTALRDRLRECKNPRCPLMFVDLSRPGKRAWCAMRRCGNLQKTTRYRRRLRSTRQDRRDGEG